MEREGGKKEKRKKDTCTYTLTNIQLQLPTTTMESLSPIQWASDEIKQLRIRFDYGDNGYDSKN